VEHELQGVRVTLNPTQKTAAYWLGAVAGGIAGAVMWKQHRIIGFLVGQFIGANLTSLVTGYNPFIEWSKTAQAPAPRQEGL